MNLKLILEESNFVWNRLITLVQATESLWPIFVTCSEEDNFELDDNDMNGVVNEVIDKDKLGVFANRFDSI